MPLKRAAASFSEGAAPGAAAPAAGGALELHAASAVGDDHASMRVPPHAATSSPSGTVRLRPS